VRILYHHRTRSRDGQRVHIEGLVAALVRLGHEVAVVGPAPEDDSPIRHQRTIKRWLLPLREIGEILYNLIEGRRLSTAARDHRPEALYSRHSLLCSVPARFARRFRMPWVVEVNAPLAQEREAHGGLFFRRWARRRENRTLNAADRVIVVTAVMKAMLVKQGVEASRIEIHRNGIDRDRWDPAFDVAALRREYSLQGSSVLGFVGFVREWNRLEMLFPFLQRTPNAMLLIVGDGPDVPRLRAMAGTCGIQPQLRFTGAVKYEEVARFVAMFDVAIVPETPRYSSPLKLLDYLAQGCAILAPDRENLREILAHDRSALLFDPDDRQDLEAQLDRLLRDQKLRKRLGQEARATLDRLELTWEHNARRVVGIFQDLAKARKPRGQG